MTSDPPERSSSSPPPGAATVKPMSMFGAVGWTAGAYYLMIAFLAIALAIRENALRDLVTLQIAQMISHGLVLFAILRFYAPNVSARRFVGLRSTSIAVYPLALLFGVAITIVMDKMLELIEVRWPRPPQEVEFADLLATPSMVHRVVLGVFVGVVGPVVEEVLFRGAIFLPLRKQNEAAATDASKPAIRDERRSDGLVPTVGLTTILFVGIHNDWRAALPLAVVAVAMGLVRYQSGSLVPPILMHVGVNTFSVVATYTMPNVETIPWSWVAIGTIVSAASLTGMLLLCRGERAALARADEL